MNKKQTLIVGLIVFIFVAIAAGAFWYDQKQTREPTKLDSFAECLTAQGMTFYGAFWCPHCQNMKKLFGNAIKRINYVECSTPDAKGQTEVCKDKNIKGYPTWEFKDGSRLEGEVSLDQLAEKTQCVLPKE